MADLFVVQILDLATSQNKVLLITDFDRCIS